MRKQRGVVVLIYLAGVLMGSILGWGFATQYTDGKRVESVAKP